MKKAAQQIRVFYYYTFPDEELGKQLNQQLGILERQGKITSWYNERLLGGDQIHEVIVSEINSADLILLLISPSFLDSEVWNLIERATQDRLFKQGQIVKVVPVILRPCSWEIIGLLNQFNPLPKHPDGGTRAITSWTNQDEALAQISQEIIRLAATIQQERQQQKRQNIAIYENALYDALKRERPLRIETRKKLSRLQQILNLEDEDITFSETIVESRMGSDSINEELYRSEVKSNIREDRGEISPVSRIILDQKSQVLGIAPSVAKAIEMEELEHPQKYERIFSAIYSIDYYLGEGAKYRLMMVARKLGLDQLGLSEEIQKRILDRLRINKEDLDLILNSKIIPQDLLNKSGDKIAESEANLNYSRLRVALEAQHWKAADQETHRIFLEFASNHKWSRKVPSEKLLNFPSLDLRTIDKLWQIYSDGHFGFSPQIEVYQQCGARLNGRYEPENWGKFGQQVGWANDRHWLYYFELNFNLTAPKGHLPGKIFSAVEGPLLLQIAHIANLEFSLS
jgi:hypothetical protein